MVESSLALAREFAPAEIDLDALVQEGKRIGNGWDEAMSFQNENRMTPENVQAFKLFYKAAGAGHQEAQYLVSHCYHFGIGVEKDLVKTLDWLVKSAEAGFASAQSSLGACYEFKFFVPQDFKQALKWYQKAAEQNDDLGQSRLRGLYYRLGSMYLLGDGVRQDMSEAYKWLRLAIDQGDKYAKEKVCEMDAVISSNGLDTAMRLYRELSAKQTPGTSLQEFFAKQTPRTSLT